MQIFAIVVSLAITAVGIALFVRAIRDMLGTLRVGQPAPGRTDQPVQRTLTLVKETLGHTRMLQWTWVGIGHWFIFVGFGLLFFTLLTAFGQLFDAHFVLPLIGHFFLYEWLSEFFTVVMIGAIVAFIYYRATRPKERVRGPKGRLYRSTMWQGYFVEAVILSVGLCIVVLRGLEYALFQAEGEEYGTAFHFPFTFWLGEAFGGLSVSTLENLVYLVAMLKILVSFTWMIVISLNLTMGVAWHRFTAFFNIWLKRDASGRTALGAVKPLTSGGQRVSLDDVEEMDEDTRLGVGAAEDFSWKNVLDFTTCTECGRCQSQCPAWNTEKPLSPKLLITALRDHTYAKAPYLRAAEGDREAVLAAGGDTLVREVERPLVGETAEDEWFYMPESGSAVIDPEVLWNCTTCGACVQQCPVDIEHVDHIVDMRRYQLLVENNFPAELNQLFKGLEGKGNPWNMSPQGRLDWAKDLPFDVKVVGDSIESLDEVEWLFWVGCAGAYEDRAKKTTRAVAELLDMAGVSFGVLGNGETCTGDPARRAGNEFVFQGLATQNAETFKELKVKKVVSACAHCFNTLKNEYREFGVELEVVHHTQLLNRLVREGKLTPVADGAGAHKRSITYHDPCYIGRHNGVYTPPRELLQILPGAEVKEMPRNSERSFCCGAGGARMWMEENTGERINMNRTDEAVATGADQIAVGCPFCRVMLSDGLTMKQSKGEAREEVEVLDVAQMLLASVKGQQATKLAPGAGTTPGAAPARTAEVAATAGSAAGTSAGATATLTDDEALKAEPQDGDVTQSDDTVTATEDAGPLAKASGGSSLFDDPAGAAETTDPEKAPTEEAKAAKPASAGGSLFDLGGDDGGGEAASEAAAPAAEPAAEQGADQEAQPETASGDLGGGGSLFDLGSDTAASSGTAASEAPAEPAADLGGGGSLFDLEAPAEPAASEAATSEAATTGSAPAEPAAEEPAATERAEAEPASRPAATAEASTDAPAEAEAPAAPVADLGSGGSLFDLEAPPEPAAPAPAASSTESSDQGSDQATDTAESDTAESDPAAGAAPAADEAADRPADGQPEERSTAATSSDEAPAASTNSAATPVFGATGSLFDIAAPRAAAASSAPAAPAPDAAEAPEQSESAPSSEAASSEAASSEAPATAPSTGDGVPSGADLTAAATAVARDDEPADEAPAEAEAQVEESGDEVADDAQPDDSAATAEEVEPAQERETEQAAASGPADTAPKAEQNGSSGPAHTPRTDADISGSGSLFDL